MDLNKAMVEMYKKRSAANKQRSSSGKKPKIEQDTNKSMNISLNDDQDSRKRPSIEDVLLAMEYKPKATFDQLYGCESARDQVLKIVERFKRSTKGLAMRSDWPTLVCGSRGIGKTAIVEAAANHAKLKLVPIFLKNLVEQTRSEFKITLTQLISHCIANQPAIVLIDDLEQITDKEDLRYLIRGAIRKILDDNSNLLLFCTASSVVDIASGIDFLYTIQLKRPDTNARYNILDSLRKGNKNLSHLTDDCLKSLATKTPSFTALDLRKMLDIAETESAGQPVVLHCDKAVDMVKRTFKRGTHLIGEKPTIQWKDIGGLSEVRSEFLDVLWQLKRAGDDNTKFAGFALYGPPGCGKTMVAQAMANEAGLNFISIKPAELVDKFLGETERNIRRVFSEAQEFEPCMIYFDEFDGLCGTRGNRDNVTSAIQTLLSEMDGFVKRGKSIILASTNRLEDIDPAMKRPGRLSKHIYVGPPDEKARKEILRVITNRPTLNLSTDINLDTWASRTKHFTGADLDFLVSEAESRAGFKFAQSSEPIDIITLHNEHLEAAMERIRMTNKELDKKIKSAYPTSRSGST